MTVFDLVFVAVFFTTVAMLISVGLAVIRRRRAAAIGRLRRLGILVGGYLGIVVLVSLVSPRRVLKIGDEQRWDDWCIAVTDAQRESRQNVQSYLVTFRVFSRARRRAQSERGVRVYLMDDRGRCYDPAPEAEAVGFDVRLEPQQSVDITRRFDLPCDASDAVVVVSHGGVHPGNLVIGDPESLFHKQTVVRLAE